jgi:hypothetical protein
LLPSFGTVGFEPIISAGERPKIYVLDRVATGTGLSYLTLQYLFLSQGIQFEFTITLSL